MHKALHCTCSLKFPLFSFPTLLISFALELDHSVAIFLNLSLIIDSSDIFHSPVFAKCCLSCLLIFTTSVRILSLISCLWPPPVCALPLPQKIYFLDHLLPNPPTSCVLSCACGCFLFKIFPMFCCLFSSPWFIGVWFVFSSLRLIHLLFYMYNHHWEAWDLLPVFYMYNHHWEAWDLLPDCLVGKVS